MENGQMHFIANIAWPSQCTFVRFMLSPTFAASFSLIHSNISFFEFIKICTYPQEVIFDITVRTIGLGFIYHSRVFSGYGHTFGCSVGRTADRRGGQTDDTCQGGWRSFPERGFCVWYSSVALSQKCLALAFDCIQFERSEREYVWFACPVRMPWLIQYSINPSLYRKGSLLRRRSTWEPHFISESFAPSRDSSIPTRALTDSEKSSNASTSPMRIVGALCISLCTNNLSGGPYLCFEGSGIGLYIRHTGFDQFIGSRVFKMVQKNLIFFYIVL